MKRQKREMNSLEIAHAAIEMLRKMTPEERFAFINYRTPGVEETDMTGMFSSSRKEQDATKAKQSVAAC